MAVTGFIPMGSSIVLSLKKLLTNWDLPALNPPPTATTDLFAISLREYNLASSPCKDCNFVKASTSSLRFTEFAKFL